MKVEMDIEKRMRGSMEITEFQRRVYLALLKVPRGKTISSKELGKRIGGFHGCTSGQMLEKKKALLESELDA